MRALGVCFVRPIKNKVGGSGPPTFFSKGDESMKLSIQFEWKVIRMFFRITF